MILRCFPLFPPSLSFHSLTLLGCVAVVLPGVIGCAKKTAANEKGKEQKPPVVYVAKPVEQTITNHEEYTGRLAAVVMVDVRARVSGYLDKILFTDGADLEKDAPLFEIDPRPFEATLAQTEASVAQLEARLERLRKQESRAERLNDQKVTTIEDYELIKYQRLETESELKAARASADRARLDLEFTHIKSPITGRISRRLVDRGNLVQADTTPLATIVTLDPIYAYFDADERTVLQIRRLIAEGKIQGARDRIVHVDLALADEEEFTLQGTVDFVDNQVVATTGTLRIRAVIDNPKKLLSPGMFVRVRVPIGLPHQALVVREEALGSDQGQRYVFVVDKDNKVERRKVKPGRLEHGLRVIEEGLTADERVIVTGLQRVRPGAVVTPEPAKDIVTKAVNPVDSGKKAVLVTNPAGSGT